MALVYAHKALLPAETEVRRLVHDGRTVSATEYLDWHTPHRMRRTVIESLPSDLSSSIRTTKSARRIAIATSSSSSTFCLGRHVICLDLTTTKRHRIREQSTGYR